VRTGESLPRELSARYHRKLERRKWLRAFFRRREGGFPTRAGGKTDEFAAVAATVPPEAQKMRPATAANR